MKRLFAMVGLLVMVISGCGVSDLEDYQQALIETASYDSGSESTDLSIELEFNETGLSFEEKRDLSYYERIEMSTEAWFNSQGPKSKSVIDTYFNFGGVGFDMIYYIDGRDVLIKLPIINQYIDLRVGEEELEQEGPYEDQAIAFNKLIDAWNAVLEEEDVFSGSKAYVMTDKGQIKTTTYQVTIDDQQFNELKATILTLIEDEAVLEAFIKESQNYSTWDATSEALQASMTTMVESLELIAFEGHAYVDFDGRLVKQVFEADLVAVDAGPGKIKSLKLVYESGYDQLGKDIEIVIPQVRPEDMLDIEDGSSIKDYFPEGIF